MADWAAAQALAAQALAGAQLPAVVDWAAAQASVAQASVSASLPAVEGMELVWSPESASSPESAYSESA